MAGVGKGGGPVSDEDTDFDLPWTSYFGVRCEKCNLVSAVEAPPDIAELAARDVVAVFNLLPEEDRRKLAVFFAAHGDHDPTAVVFDAAELPEA